MRARGRRRAHRLPTARPSRRAAADTATKNNKKLKSLYSKALQIRSAIPHPKIMGVIRECGGKMHMAQREFEKARNDFFEAFKNYDEAGVSGRISCLKYLVLANMLMNSDINPFDSPEAKPCAHTRYDVETRALLPRLVLPHAPALPRADH